MAIDYSKLKAGTVYSCLIKGAETETTRTALLRYVDEPDNSWRVYESDEDAFEDKLSNFWTVVSVSD